MDNRPNHLLPDVARESRVDSYASIDWVGMDSIEMPVFIQQLAEGHRIPARVEAKVSLDKKSSRGIHMSRLYLAVQEKLSKKNLTLETLGQISREFLMTHEELSSRAKVQVNFEVPLLRPALKSQNVAWRSYPVKLSALNQNGMIKYFIEVLVTYSSTCPASAALARQLIQQSFQQSFAGKEMRFDQVYEWLGTSHGIVATPHAQRSYAKVKVEVEVGFDFTSLIDTIEEVLATPVQGAVKREDEQEFALRNGQNLMFCEDAGRRIKSALEAEVGVMDYIAELSHFESLHPHNAVALVSKGLCLKSF
jgi:GTP cyclohydrolase I